MKKIKFAAAAIITVLLMGCGNGGGEALPVQVIVPQESITVETAYIETEEGAVTPNEDLTETLIETASETETSPAEIWETVSFAAVGDNLIHSSIYNQAAGRSDNGGYDFTYAYEAVSDIIEEADIAIINQETLICNDEFEPSTYPCFNSPTALGNHMIYIGFDVFTIANNHTLDKGVSGLNACLDCWESKDVTVVGAYRNAEDAANIRTNNVNGITFSYLAYTESLNGLSLPSDSELVIGNALDIDKMAEDIRSAKQISDICIVALHWGVENSDVISDYQRSTAKILAEAGADIIIGNHPHVLRDIEWIERDDGSLTLCAYSLGNFISAQSVGQNLIGGILEFNVSVCTSDKESNKSVISDVRLIPIVTHYGDDYSDVRIYKLSDYTPELASEHGVNSMSIFGYDYIFEILEKNISEEFLEIENVG
ncbi:MAG: CapA family protein [Oscillospiraceae bacterium]|nr:CapA family protein [Oscillospiraceae bacterium]